MAGPWEKYQQPQMPVAIDLPQSPQRKRDNDRQDANDSRAATNEAERIRLAKEKFAFDQAQAGRSAIEWNAKNNPDGSPKAVPKPPISEEDMAAVRAEAQHKLGLIDSLGNRSKDEWFATGFGAKTMADLFPASPAGGVRADVETVSGSGALSRILELAKQNGGKNPLTPLSNSDVVLLGKSIANLDPGQSDAQFQRNLKPYRDIYARALQATDPVERGRTILEQKISRLSPAAQRVGREQFAKDPRVTGLKPPPPRRTKAGGDVDAILSKYGVR